MTTVEKRAGLTIADVARVLAVPAPTLRAWERRYGIPATDRSPGGHRRYTPEQVDAIRLMRDEIARGQRASSAARAVRELLETSGPSASSIEEFLRASADGDVRAMRRLLDRSNAALGVDGVVDSVLIPAMRRIGQWWDTGRCDTGQEALATEVCRSWLDRELARVAGPANGSGPLLLACAPVDEHTIGIEALELCVRSRGIATRSLGARVSIDALRAAVVATEPAGVVVACQLSSGRRRAVEVLSRLAETRGLPLFFGGSAFGTQRSRRGVPGRYLGTSFADAAETVAARLTGVDSELPAGQAAGAEPAAWTR